jgi:DNA invertase Pin-like site-specific DNA recombinase
MNTTIIVGYARVSTEDQSTAIQVEKLEEFGCQRIFKENKSGGKAGRWDRPKLHEAIESLKEGDTLVVWKLDRLSRSLSDLLHILKQLKDKGAHFRSLTEAVETESPHGRMVMQMLGVFAEFERAMIRERTKIGLARARAQGRVGGPKFKLSPDQQQAVVEMMNADKTQSDVAKLFNVDRSTISRLMSERRVLERKA